jgi:F-box only protein C-terminal region/F-box-like
MLNVFSRLPASSLAAASLACRQWNRIAQVRLVHPSAAAAACPHMHLPCTCFNACWQRCWHSNSVRRACVLAVVQLCMCEHAPMRFACADTTLVAKPVCRNVLPLRRTRQRIPGQNSLRVRPVSLSLLARHALVSVATAQAHRLHAGMLNVPCGHGCNDVASVKIAHESTDEVRACACSNSWKRMFAERPHVRTDGVYVSRNTYFRVGVVHWDVKNPVHLVVYYRYFRFFPDGTLLTRTSAEPLQRVWQSLHTKPALLSRRDSRLQGQWKLQVCC